MRLKILYLFVILSFFLNGCDDKEGSTTTVLSSSSGIEKSDLDKSTKDDVKTLTSKVVLKTIDGKEIKVEKIGDKEFKFDGYEDKIILINFFATWCMPCNAEAPHLVNLQRKYRDKGFEIIAVLLEDVGENGLPSEELRAYIEHHEINYVVTIDKNSNDVLEKLSGGTGSIPFMIMYDKNGKYYTHYKGSVPEEMIETDIKNAINK